MNVSLIEWHKALRAILSNLNPEIFISHNALFSGGTKIVFDYGDYRWSRDLDFQCSDKINYLKLLATVKNDGVAKLFKQKLHKDLILPESPFVINKDAIRLMVGIAGIKVKIEIFHEVRFVDQGHKMLPHIEIPAITDEDSFISKVFANSDRHADRENCQRDIIDLGYLIVQNNTKGHYLLYNALSKTRLVYGHAAARDLLVSACNFLSNEQWRTNSMRALQIAPEYESEIITGVQKIGKITREYINANKIDISRIPTDALDDLFGQDEISSNNISDGLKP